MSCPADLGGPVDRGLRFARALLDLDFPEANDLLRDPALDSLTWPVRWTWLALLSLVCRNPHGLTWASRKAFAVARAKFEAKGSSVSAVKRHMRDLERRGLALGFEEVRPFERGAIQRLQVTVVLFPDRSGFRKGRSPEARELVHGWGGHRGAAQSDQGFPGPLVATGSGKPRRRQVLFVDLVPRSAERADQAAVRQGPPLSGSQIGRELAPRMENHAPAASTAGATQAQNPDPDRASAGMCRASAGVSQASDLPCDLPGSGTLAEPVPSAGYPVQGLRAHRRPKGGTLVHPRPQGGISPSLPSDDGRAT